MNNQKKDYQKPDLIDLRVINETSALCSAGGGFSGSGCSDGSGESADCFAGTNTAQYCGTGVSAGTNCSSGTGGNT